MTQNRDELIRCLFSEAADRVIRGDDPDPAMAVVATLSQGGNVPEAELELILRAHTQGPWVVGSKKELAVFAHWCEAAGSPLELGEPVVVEGLRLYRDNFGDCCLSEAARGARYAVWTRKGRLQIGFKDEADARAFRAADNLFSKEETGNKRTALVVVEGGDNPKTIARAARALAIIG